MTFVGRAKSWITRDVYTAKEVERAERDPWRIGKMPNRDGDEPEEAGEPGGQRVGGARAYATGSHDDNDLDSRLDALEEQIQQLAEALSQVIGMLEKAAGDDAGRRRGHDDENSFAGNEGLGNLEEAHSDAYGVRDAAALAKLNGVHARHYGLPSEYRDVLTLNRETLAARANETKNIRGAHDLHSASQRLSDLQRLHDLTWPAGRVF